MNNIDRYIFLKVGICAILVNLRILAITTQPSQYLQPAMNHESNKFHLPLNLSYILGDFS